MAVTNDNARGQDFLDLFFVETQAGSASARFHGHFATWIRLPFGRGTVRIETAMANEHDKKDAKKDTPAPESEAAELVNELGVVSDEDLDGVSGGVTSGGLDKRGGDLGRRGGTLD
jgi:hypothetical protein